jgi:hypothetical protein
MAHGRGITLFGILKWIAILAAVVIAGIAGFLGYALVALTVVHLAKQFARGAPWGTIVVFPAFLWGAGLGVMSSLGTLGITDMVLHAGISGVVGVLVALCGWPVLKGAYGIVLRAFSGEGYR